MNNITKTCRWLAVVRRCTHALWFGLFAITLVSGQSEADAASVTVDSLRSSILALDSARDTAVKELEEENLTATERVDYIDFVVYLNTRIFIYCEELEPLATTNLVEDLPCPSLAMLGVSEEETSQEHKSVILPLPSEQSARAKTPTEKTENLQDEFLAALGEFDELLAKEEEQVASRVPSQRESGNGQGERNSEVSSSGAEGRGAGEEGSSAAWGDEPIGSTAAGTSPDAEVSSQGQASVDDHSLYGAPGGTLPPPEDDDIVARQLREAAEKEPDTELREKLWQEYWKYKGVLKK